MAVQLDLWLWPIDLDAVWLARLSAHLSPDERARAERFVFVRDRDRFIAARGKMREILARRCGMAPADLAFEYNAHGKPAIPDGPAFNLSHTGGWAALVVSSGPVVGIDIELLRPVETALSQHVFSAAEQQELAEYSGPDWTAAFYRGWTRKEAYLKACGSGLARALDSFDVSLGEESEARITRIDYPPDTPTDWTLKHLDLGADLMGAIAVQTSAQTHLVRHA